MYFVFVLAAGVTASIVGWALLMALVVLQLGPVQRIGLDDATTLIGVIGAFGAAGFTRWMPRCRFGWLTRISGVHLKSGRTLATLLVLFALYWTGYLLQREASTLDERCNAWCAAHGFRDGARDPTPPNIRCPNATAKI